LKALDQAQRSLAAAMEIVAEHVGPFRVAELSAGVTIAARDRGLSG
jgi:hypothetical protein